MRVLALASSLAMFGVSVLRGSDPGCPQYPASARTELQTQLDSERDFFQFSTRAGKKPLRSATKRNNFVDDQILGKMEADGVAPAGITSDAEFLRRVTIDLTGRIPTPERFPA